MAPTRSAMFWAKSREIVGGGEAGKEPQGLKRRGEEGGARRRRRKKGCGRSDANEPTGRGSRRSASTREPSGQSNRSRPGQTSPTHYVEGWGRRGYDWGRGVEKAGRQGRAAAEGAVALRGDVRSSWSRGLPPAADVRREQSGTFCGRGNSPPLLKGSPPPPSRVRPELEWRGCREGAKEAPHPRGLKATRRAPSRPPRSSRAESGSGRRAPVRGAARAERCLAGVGAVGRPRESTGTLSVSEVCPAFGAGGSRDDLCGKEVEILSKGEKRHEIQSCRLSVCFRQ